MFDVTGNVQATTYFPVTSLFTVNASGSNGDFGYSISDTRFTISANVVDLTATVASPTVISVSVIATDELFGDSATLLVTVDIVNPPALSVSTNLLQTYFLVGSVGAVANVTPAAGYAQNGYSIYFVPTTDNDYFALSNEAPDSAGVIVSLTASVDEIRVLTATIAIADAHPLNAAITQEITVNIVTLFSAELTQWFTTLTTGSQRSFGSIALENVAGSVSYTLLEDAVGNIAINDNGIVSITANITSPTALTLGIAITDDVGDFSSTITLGSTLHLADAALFTPVDQIQVSVNHLVTQVAGEQNIAISPVVASDGYIGNAQYQFELINSAVAGVFTLSVLSATQAELRVSGTLLASSTLIATIRVSDVTPENVRDVLVTLVVNDPLSVANLSLYYWLQPQGIGNTINITTAGGVLPLVSVQVAVTPLAASAQLSLTVTDNIIQIVDYDYIANAPFGSTLSLSLAVFDSVNSAATADNVEVVLIDAISLPSTKQLTAEVGDVTGSLYTVAASGGAGSYLYQTISVHPEAMATLVTLSPLGAQDAVLSLAGITLSIETIIQVVVSADDGYTQATQTVEIVVDANSLTDGSLHGFGKLMKSGGASFGGYQPASVYVTNDTFNLNNWTSLDPTPGNDVSGANPPWYQAGVYYNGYIYLTGGDILPTSGITTDQVWRSRDGTDWELIGKLPSSGAHPGYPESSGGERRGHKIVVLNNKMVLLGGGYEYVNQNSVWSSIDGINWELLTANGPGVGELFPAAVMNNTLYVAAHYSSRNPLNTDGVMLEDLWSSADGANWTVHSNMFPNAYRYIGSEALVFRGSLFIIETDPFRASNEVKIRYSSTPLIASSWQSYDAPASIQNKDKAAMVVYGDKMLIMGGNNSNLLGSKSGAEGTWELINQNVLYLAEAANLFVIGDTPTPEQVPLLEASFVSVTSAVITLAIAEDGLSATTTISAGYSGVLASLSISGGYLGSEDYQINTSGDDTVLQLGADGQISVGSGQNGGQTFHLTVEIDDQYSENATDSKTLLFVVEVLPN